ncbi:MAG: response regulator [Verrucomicrobiales bacterium]|nr:response regulator [Verrucomicrobiales bacterium]
MNILLVEDHESDAFYIQQILESYPGTTISVKWVQTRAEAVHEIETRQYHICLLDLGLPDSIGLESVESIAAANRNVPIIALTGNGDKAIILALISKGADEYLSKNELEPELLYRTIRYAIERRRYRDQLESAEQARRSADAANQAKSEFLASVSHEIRTPLNSILGFSQLIQHEDDLGEKAAHYIDSVINSSEHLLTLINDVLDMSRIEAGHSSLNETRFDPHQLINDLQSIFKHRTEEKKIDLEFIKSGSLPIPTMIRSDMGKIRQILVNLIGNSVKFTEKGSIKVYWELVGFSGTNARFRFRVKDTGYGISENDLDRIFEPFVQASYGKAWEGSTGLGLAISRKFARLMEGDIQVRSELGKGSIFQFECNLELCEESMGTLSDEPEETNPFQRKFSPENSPRILIVDDADANRRLLTTILKNSGYEVRQASTGEDGIKEFENWNPHAILMDWRMPGIGGMEATRQIKTTERGRKTPVICVTASAMGDVQEECEKVGADGFLLKPYKLAHIIDLVSGTLARTPLPR